MYVHPKVIIFGVATTVKLTVLGVWAYKMHQKAEKERAEINLERQARLEEIQIAADIVRSKIQNGDYNARQDITEVMSDFEFYQIAVREEQ
jgi:hypothetical protein